jgi:hypothetical protein
MALLFIFRMAHQPHFQFVASSTTQLRLEPTAEANQVARTNKNRPFCPAKQPGLVESVARYQLRGKTITLMLILACSELQFGQYRGKSFKWLLENAVGYAVGLIESIRKEGRSNDSPLGVNKQKLVEFTTSFPEINRALEDRELHTAAEAMVKATGDEGERLVGFGQHYRMSRKAVYESADREHKSYVQYMLRKTDCRPGTNMQQFRDYCMRRQQQQGEHQKQSTPSQQASSQSTSSQPAPPLDSSESSQPGPSTLSQPAPPTGLSQSDEETDMEDEELLAAISLIESQYYLLMFISSYCTVSKSIFISHVI